MKLIVNGEALEASAATLAELLDELDYEGAWLATAVNGEVVRAGERPVFSLGEEDRIEILSPMQGG
jgi:sulfur carrier protein